MRQKNALRKHYIAPFSEEAPAKEAYLVLAKYIETVDDETDEDTDDTGFYDGDGNKEEFVISISAGRSFEGYHDPEDKAQALIASLRFKTGEDRRVWFKEVSADGKKQFEGIANVSDIKIGGGDATDYEEFGCTIRWVGAPKESAVVG